MPSEEPLNPFPKDIIEEQLAAIWREVLDLPSVQIHDDFFNLGGTSLDTSVVCHRIKKAFARELPLKVLIEAPTIAQLASVLREDPNCRVPVIVSLRQSGSRPPLFCLPGAAGNIIALRDFWTNLPEDQPVYGIEPKLISEEVRAKGSECGPSGEPLNGSVEEIAASYLPEILEAQPHGPYYLVGLCFGALVVFEMARLLIARGETVAFLGLMDPPAPGLRRHRLSLSTALSAFFQATWQERLHSIRTIGASYWQGIQVRWHALLLHVPGRLPYALVDRRSLNVLAASRYNPTPCTSPFTIFLAEGNGPSDTSHRRQEWERLTTCPVEIEYVPGDHGAFFKYPNAAALVERLIKHLRPAQKLHTTKRVPA